MPDEHPSTSNEWELFLLALRYRDSRLITLSGNEPFLLSGGDSAWLVYKGMVDVFAVQLDGGTAASARHHLFRAYDNQLLLGFDLSDCPVGLLASCAPETQLLRFSQSRLRQLLEKPDNLPPITTLLEQWMRALSAGISSAVKPKDFRVMELDKELALEAGQIARPTRTVLWAQIGEGSARFLGRDDRSPLGPDSLVPLTDRTWVKAAEATRLRALSTAAILQANPGWEPLAQFGGLVLSVIDGDMRREQQAATQMIRQNVANDALRIRTAVSRLAATWSDQSLSDSISVESPDPLVAACRALGESLGVTIRTPPDYDSQDPRQNSLAEIARASQLRTRLVLLRDGWWRRDSGPLLAYRGDTTHPVALLPAGRKGYTLIDPVEHETVPATEAVAAELTGTAHMFYRPFPDRPLSAWDVLRFGLRGTGLDLGHLLLVGAAGGGLGLVTPIVTRLVFDRLIPSGDHSQLLVFGALLVISAIALALFQVVRSFALLRLESRMDSSIQAAIWDRLLSLPPDFFRRYTAGDLTQRATGVSAIKQTLSGSVTLAILAGLFSWANLLLMLYYDVPLALAALGLALIATLVTLGLGLRLLRHEREVTHAQGELSGLIAQLVGGISKLRVAGAEGRAFFLWASDFSRQKKTSFRASSVNNYLSTFIAGYPVLAAMVIFAAINDRMGMTTGTFLAFYAAFVQFMAAGLQFASAFVVALTVVPLYERLKPILRERPEVDEQKAHPGPLSGVIEVSHVLFRYDKDGPLVLDDVSFTVEPGEFVALVGASGSGKSTLLRLLLGFEKPDSGAVYYDGQALAEIDLRAVRRQIGVVLQHSQVMTGPILDNILGASNLSVEDAWEAARRAGIAADIQQMPMGMQTYISEGGSTLSGGQRQRLLIARALVARPRIIFFDEATSALDDRSQAQVTESLKQVDATRLVIAHRLSTIMDADRILVMHRGRLVESGTYQELLAQNGVFAQLAQRQLV